MTTIPSEITALFPNIAEGRIRIEQVSEEAGTIINKVYQGTPLDEQERDVLLNPTEVAVLLMAKYRKPISHRYVKDISRTYTSKNTGRVTPARLHHDRVAGSTFLYKTGKVLEVKMRDAASKAIVAKINAIS